MSKLMDSSSKKIEITVISAEDLTNKRQPVKKNVFVVVKTDPINSLSTVMDKQGGSYPVWNQKLNMDLPLYARSITVQVHWGNRVIGSCNIPVSDFSGGYLPENYLSFLSYRLRNAGGEKNGIINLSIMVKGSVGNNGCAASCSRPWIGVPPVDGKPVTAGGFVTGIPVSYKY